MKCLLDMDGVLVDFVAGACALHQWERAWLYERWPVNDWDLHTAAGMAEHQFFAPMEEDYWAGLPWTEDGKELLALVEELSGGPDNVCLLTAPTRNHGCPRGKMMWVEQHLPHYRKHILIGKAKAFLANPRLLLVDDKNENVQEYREAGGPAVLVPRRWNTLHGVTDTVDYLRRAICDVMF